MAVSLGHNQYGKAETRLLRVYRDSDPHELVDYNVSVALSGDFIDTHLTGDNAKVLTTDAMKNTVNAYAKEHGDAARQPESFGLALARHFVDDNDQVQRARVRLRMYPWNRLDHGGCTSPPCLHPTTAATCGPPSSRTTGRAGSSPVWTS